MVSYIHTPVDDIDKSKPIDIITCYVSIKIEELVIII